MPGGDLLEAIRKKKSFAEKEACKIFTQILTAIAYLHANGIAHRDIKV
jgi:serine/threonine protein kinase